MANSNIFAQYVKPVRSVQEYAQDYDAAESNQLALGAKRMQMQQAQRGMADDEAVRGIVRQYGSDKNALVKALYGGGFATQAQGIEKSIADADKAKADLAKTGADTKNTLSQADERAYKLAKQKDDDVNMALGALANDPALSLGKVSGVLQGLVSAGRITPQFMEQALQGMPDDPNVIRGDLLAKVRAQMTPEQLIKLYTPNIEYKDSGQQLIPVNTNPNSIDYKAPTPIQRMQTPDSVASNATSVENNKRTVGATIRGQDKVDARAREGTWSLNADGVLVNSRSGETKAATGAGGKPVGSPKLNELQGKATGFASRMKDAEKTLGELENKVMPSQVAVAGYKSEFPNWLPGGQILGAGITAANRTLNPYVTEEAMKYQQAQENWVTANLRLESGAVIGPEEMQKEIQKYFPQPGDPKSLRDQKKAARAVAQRAVTAQAGPGQNMIEGIAAGQPSGGASGTWDNADPLGLRR